MMKIDNLVLIAAAGLGLYLVARVAQGKPVSFMGTSAAPTSTGAARQNAVTSPQLITNTALPGGPGWAWQYFTDGTAIGPDGKYYKGGQEVYDPAGILGAA